MEKMTVAKLREKKNRKERITMLTAYDYTFARMVDEAGADVVLVGDSLGMVVLGHSTTLPVTMEDMLRHTQAVCRGVSRGMVVADMPFLSYQASEEDALRNAGRFLKETGAEGVKLEGGRSIQNTVRRLVESGIPVMGHLGLTPQSVHAFGGYKVQGKTEEAARKLVEDARALQEAGCFSLVLECVPATLGKEITEALQIPTIGIGAGKYCDGQVLVLYDALGLSTDLHPKFVKRFAGLWDAGIEGLKRYMSEVKDGAFPSDEHSF